MDSEDEGGFLPPPVNTNRPSHQSTSRHQHGGHLHYGRPSMQEQHGTYEEPLYSKVAPRTSWPQRRGFSEPGPPKGPRPWLPHVAANQIKQHPITTSHRFSAPAPQAFVSHDVAGQFLIDSVGGGGQYDPLEGHFGVDTEMMEERWLHMQEARRRQQVGSDYGGAGYPSSQNVQREQLAATYSPGSSRQIYIQRKDGGFGFTLRHFIVYPPEDEAKDAPPISEPMDTIFVKFIKDGGPATLAGLQVGDRLIAVNGESVAGLTYAQVVQLIQNTKGMLRLVVVPEKDDILQVYFSDIAQDPKSNTRIEQTSSGMVGEGWLGGALQGSGSSRDSSPFSSKASYGGAACGHASGRLEQEPVYECVGGSGGDIGSTEHVYARPALAGASSVSTLGSGSGGGRMGGSHMVSSKDSLNSESSLQHPAVQHPSQQDDQMIDKIKKDCEKKKEFLEKPVYPSYLSSGGHPINLGVPGATPNLASPPKEVNANPYGIASLANTMPPPAVAQEEKKDEPAPAAAATKNFFMDIYAKEVSKMQSASKSSAPTKKRNFDATQFNTYGRPLGYRRGGHFYETDSFSRNNFVIIGTRSLHCEPPQTYERPEPEPKPVCEGCYECQVAAPAAIYPYPTAAPCYCPVCLPVQPTSGCPECAAMTHPPQQYPHHHNHTITGFVPQLSSHHHLHRHDHGPSPPPAPRRPSTLPGLKPDGGIRDSPPCVRQPVVPTQSTPVQMHPDPSTVYGSVGYSLPQLDDGSPASSGNGNLRMVEASSHMIGNTVASITSPYYDGRQVVSYRRSSPRHESEADRNLRRVSYLKATKDEQMDTDENEGGIAPTHSIKKLKSIFSDKAGATDITASSGARAQSPLSVKAGENSSEGTPAPAYSPKRKPSFEKAGSVTSMLTEGGGLKEGYLSCKVAVLDGRKATDRSWKSVYAVLKSKALYMYKDKKTAQENLEEFEEKPVKLAESEVEVANDYTKRKNVFRVKTELGSEYLFQAENELLMKDWVKTIDEAAMAVIIDERKGNKLNKLASFRNRSPTAQSPSAKPRKPSGESLQPLVGKDKKNWKGKVVKQLKKMGGGGAQGGGVPSYPEGGSIGVPLEECPLASDIDLIVPYVVKLCCDIVTERGLEIVGIYRVPGNNAAVNFLTEQINRGVPHYQLEDSRWQDVNVVSSLLKLFFRKLPDPLFTMDMYSLFIEASKIEQANKRLEALRRLVRDLPEIHQETLKYVTKHLCNVADNSTTNKMEVRNLAIVFGPTLVRTTDDNMVTMVTDMSQQCRIIESLLSNWDYFFADTEVELDVGDSDLPETSMEVSVTNSHQSVMLANLHKLEDSGKLSSPKGEVSAKDIMSSIISAANRKIKKTGKKENSATDLEELTRDKNEELSDSRRESESVIHGALQIATAVPGLLAPFSTQSLSSGSRGCSSPPTPSEDTKSFSSRRNSRDSYPSADGLKRRGSLPAAPQSKRGSITSYTAVVTSSSSGVTKSVEYSEAMVTNVESPVKDGGQIGSDSVRSQDPVIIQSDTEAIRNGIDENQQVIRGTLSLVNMSTNSQSSQPMYPFQTYTGLQEAQSQRIKQFEAETKAMMHRSVEQSSSRTSIDEQTNTSNEQMDGENWQHQRSYSTPHLLSSITTPVPDTDPLTGGILLEDHYHTDAYDRVGTVETTYLPQYRASTISNLLHMDKSAKARHALPPEILEAFDTNKVVKRGTLQRLKIRRVESDDGSSSMVETVMEDLEDRDDQDIDKDALGQLSASFDKKLKIILGPGPNSVYSSPAPAPATSSSTWMESGNSTDNVLHHHLHTDSAGQQADEDSQSLDMNFEEQLRDFVSNPGSKKELDDVKNSLLRHKKVRRGGRVDKNHEPELRRTVNKPLTSSRSQLVLRQINNRKPLKRSDSLTKREKTELNLKTKEVEKENKVMKLKEQFEARSNQSQSTTLTSLQPVQANKIDVNKIRKKLSDNRNNRIKRRHTVGGTKDFPDKLMNKVNQERGGEVCWDRLAPALSFQEVKPTTAPDWDDRRGSGSSEAVLFGRLEDSEERRLSLPDYGGLMDLDLPMESHV